MTSRVLCILYSCEPSISTWAVGQREGDSHGHQSPDWESITQCPSVANGGIPNILVVVSWTLDILPHMGVISKETHICLVRTIQTQCLRDSCLFTNDSCQSQRKHQMTQFGLHTHACCQGLRTHWLTTLGPFLTHRPGEGGQCDCQHCHVREGEFPKEKMLAETDTHCRKESLHCC